MKQSLKKIVGASLLASFALVVAFFFSSCSKSGYGAAGSATITYTLSGNASGGQAVPASSNSTGSGAFSGTYNSGTKVMSYTTTWANLSGAPVSGGLFTGAVGMVGTSITAWSLGSGLDVSGTFSSSTTLNADQEAQLLSGNSYYLLGTTANATGEIRGQITASTVMSGGGY